MAASLSYSPEVLVSDSLGRDAGDSWRCWRGLDRNLGDALEGAVLGLMGLCWPQPLRRCAAGLERAGETADEGGLGAPCRIGEADAACGFLHPHRDLDKTQPEPRQIRSWERTKCREST